MKTVAGENISENIKLGLEAIQDAISNNSDELNFSNLELNEDEVSFLLEKALEKGYHFEKVDLSNNKLTKLPEELFKFNDLQEIDLDNNSISELPDDIDKLEHLIILDLSNNNLSLVPPTIGNYKNLERLYLSGNKLSELPPEIGELDYLKELDLSNNKLIKLTSAIGKLRKLTKLDLGKNNLSELPPEIGELYKYLSELYVDENKNLSELPARIGNLRNLRLLDLNNTNLSKLPSEIGDLESLLTLNLSNTKLSKLPAEIGKLQHLEELLLKNCNLSELPNELSIVQNLEQLDLSGNHISKLPHEIGKLENLVILDLSSNNLTELTPEIGKLENLEKLHITKNEKISKLPPEIGKLKFLKILDLSSNNIIELPTEIGKLKNLQKLYLNNNKISQLTSEIGKLKKLQELNLNNNKISQLTSEIGKLKKLQEFIISENDLEIIPQEIGNLQELQELDFRDNSILVIPSEINNLEKLVMIDLSFNRVSQVPDNMDILANLESLNLIENPLSQEAMISLNTNFNDDVVEFNMADHEIASDYNKVLAKIYGEEIEEIEKIVTYIENLNPSWSFLNGNDAIEEAQGELNKIKSGELDDSDGSKKRKAESTIQEHTYTATDVLKKLLEKIPLGPNEQQMYFEGAKRIIDPILDPSTSNANKQSSLLQIAKLLGNCATPVKDALIQCYIEKHQNSNPLPKGYDSLVARVALENEILSELKNKKVNNKNVLRKTEKIEQIQGLTNTIFTEGAATNRFNKCKIAFAAGERPETLPSITAYEDNAFLLVSDELALELVKLCCKTNEKGEPLKNEEGHYLFSPNKLRGIVGKYKHKALGIKNKIESAILEYTKKIEKTDVYRNLACSYVGEDGADDFIDRKTQEQELRELLLEVSDSEIATAAAAHFDTQRNLMEKLIQNYEEKEKLENVQEKEQGNTILDGKNLRALALQSSVKKQKKTKTSRLKRDGVGRNSNSTIEENNKRRRVHR